MFEMKRSPQVGLLLLLLLSVWNHRSVAQQMKPQTEIVIEYRQSESDPPLPPEASHSWRSGWCSFRANRSGSFTIMVEHEIPGAARRLAYGNVWQHVKKGNVIPINEALYRLSSVDQGMVLRFSRDDDLHLASLSNDLVIPIHGQCVVNDHAVVVIDNDSDSHDDWLVAVAPIAESRIALLRTSPRSHFTNNLTLYFDADGKRSQKTPLRIGNQIVVGNRSYRIDHIHLPNDQTGVVGWIGATRQNK